MASRSIPASQPRVHFLSNLRTTLTVLVIYMHTSIAYGGEGSWPYRSKHHLVSDILGGLNGIAQTFYMGTFFVLSGYVSRLALERKLKADFLRDKFVRLAIPTVVYSLVGPPLQTIALRVILEGKSADISATVLQHWRTLKGIHGPVWYCALLLIFDTIFVFLRPALPVTDQAPGFKQLAAGISLSTMMSFIVRVRWASTYTWAPLNLRIGYCPQYVLAYTLGLRIRNPQSWDPLPSPLGWTLGAATVTAVSLAVGALNIFPEFTEDDYSGGLNAIAAGYAVANETIGYLLFAMLFTTFRRFAQEPWSLNRYAYGAFLVHPVVSVAIEAALNS